jgi:hypothetical protein
MLKIIKKKIIIIIKEVQVEKTLQKVKNKKNISFYNNNNKFK